MISDTYAYYGILSTIKSTEVLKEGRTVIS